MFKPVNLFRFLNKFYHNLQIHETSPNLDGGLTGDDLPRLLAELEELQNKFDQMAVNKHKLNKELDSCIQRLDAAQSIIDR